MKLHFLSKIYQKTLELSRHKKAPRYLVLVSFIDSSIFPISPNFMLLAMGFAQPERAFWFAFITALSSILGGILGYLLGILAFESIVQPLFQWLGYMEQYQMGLQWFQNWGFIAIILGCLSPFIPFKIFTIGAGALKLPFWWFLLAASIGRSLRFFIIASIIYWGGPKMEPFLRRTFVKTE